MKAVKAWDLVERLATDADFRGRLSSLDAKGKRALLDRDGFAGVTLADIRSLAAKSRQTPVTINTPSVGEAKPSLDGVSSAGFGQVASGSSAGFGQVASGSSAGFGQVASGSSAGFGQVASGSSAGFGQVASGSSAGFGQVASGSSAGFGQVASGSSAVGMVGVSSAGFGQVVSAAAVKAA